MFRNIRKQSYACAGPH